MLCENHAMEAFLDRLDEKQKLLFHALDHFFLQQFEMGRKIRYRIPFYDGQTWVCYLNPVKKSGIELVYLRGRDLFNAQGLLDARGRKMVAGVLIYELEEIPWRSLEEITQEALMLDEGKFKTD